MTKIILVRHGQTDWNKRHLWQGLTDNPLNQKGREQAKEAGLILKQEVFDLIVASPLIRAYETASIIASEVGYSNIIQKDQELVERDFGSIEGKGIKEFAPYVLNNEVEDMEKHEMIQTRVYQALMRIAQQHHGKTILVVCHSHVIKALLSKLEPVAYQFDYRLPNTSITKIKYNHCKNDFEIVEVNNY